MAADYGLASFILQTEQGTASGVLLTLTFSGSVVSGLLVSKREFADWVAESLTPAKNATHVDDVSTRLLEAAITDPRILDDLRRDVGPQQGDEKVLTLEDMDLVHLKNVHLWQAGSSVRLVYWRGRLETVTGWTLGTVDMYLQALQQILQNA